MVLFEPVTFELTSQLQLNLNEGRKMQAQVWLVGYFFKKNYEKRHGTSMEVSASDDLQGRM